MPSIRQARVTPATGELTFAEQTSQTTVGSGSTGATAPTDQIIAGQTAAGPAGAPGSIWRDGSGAPSNNVGINGDYYLDDLTGNVYAKSSGTYSIRSNVTGPSVTTLDATASLTLSATIGATVSQTLITTGRNLLCVEVAAITGGSPQNYILALYDGNPTNDLLLYQATGITADSFIDKAPFYLPAPSSGSVVAEATNIDADATVIALTLRYFLA